MSPSVRSATEIVVFPELRHHRGSIGYLEKMVIGQLALISQARLILETGAFRGQTTRFLGEFVSLNRLAPCRVVSFDLPDVLGVMQREDPYFAEHPEIEFVAGALPETLAAFLAHCEQPIDLAIIDAEHSYRAVTEELELIHRWLRPGGYVFCHDYRESDPTYRRDVRRRPVRSRVPVLGPSADLGPARWRRDRLGRRAAQEAASARPELRPVGVSPAAGLCAPAAEASETSLEQGPARHHPETTILGVRLMRTCLGAPRR